MVRAMFVTFAMEQSRRDDYDTDASLEYSDDETRQQFLDFYEDVLPEFRNAGKVVQFKVINLNVCGSPNSSWCRALICFFKLVVSGELQL